MGAYTVIFSFTRKTHLPLLAAAFTLALLAGLIPPATSILVGKVMNLFSQFDAGTISDHDLELDTQRWVFGLVILGGAALFVRACFYCVWMINGDLQAKVVREDLFSSLTIRDFEWFEAQPSGVGSLLGRIQVQVREFQLSVSQPLGMVTLIISQTISSLGVAFYYNWKLTLVLLAVFPLIALTLFFLNRGLQSAVEHQHKEMANAAKQAMHATSNVSLLKCYNGLPQERQRYDRILQLVSHYYSRQVIKAARQIAFMRLAAVALLVIALSFGSYLVHHSDATTGAILSTFWCCGTASKGFSDVLAQSSVLEKGRAGALALKSLMDFVGKGKRLLQEGNTCTPSTLVGDIAFENVTFAYPSNPHQVILDRLDLTIRAHRMTFIIGSSGSGKSTISHLLLKLYTPRGGQITVDGKALYQLDTDWLRNNITVVQQDSVLFNETLSKNIALGHHCFDDLNEQHIHNSAQFAMLTETTRDLPHGFDTMVGKGGSSLSGGQQQRVALARARLRDTPILILDECTSALDHTTRVALFNNIRNWRRDKTTVIITHDLSQIEPFDLTYVLRTGIVVARGCRADLESLPDWPSKPNKAYNSSALSPAPNESSLDYPWNRDLLYKSPNLSQNSLRKESSQDLFEDHIALLEFNADSSVATKPDRGRTFRSFLRRERYHVPKQPSDAPNNLDQELDTATVHSEWEMPRMTKYRTMRNRLTMTQAARPYSAYPSLSARLYHPDEEAQQPMLPETILPPPRDVNKVQHSIKDTSATIVSDRNLRKLSLQKILATIWPSLSAANRRWLVGALFMSIVYGAVPTAVSWTTVKLFQTLYQASGWVEESRKWSLILMVIALAEAVAAFCIHLAFETLAQSWINVLRLSAFITVLKKSKSWFDEDNPSIDEICITIDRCAEEMRNIFGRFVPFVLIVVVMVVIALTLCFAKCWKLTLLGVGCAPGIYLVTKVFQMTSVFWELRITDAVNNISDVFAESFGDVRTIRALTLESYFHRKFMAANLRTFTLGLKRATSVGICYGISESLVPFVIAAVFKYAIIVARSPQFSTHDVLIVLSSMIFTMLGASAILAFIPQISSSIESGERLLRLTQKETHLEEVSGELKVEEDIFEGTIKLRKVTFAYPTRPEATVLRDVSLTLPSGKVTVVVGQSGSGKSTILSLILGLYRIDKCNLEASIMISGHDIAEHDISHLRSFMAYVPQQAILFPMSIRNNILYGVQESLSSGNKRLHAAAKAAGIHDFIISLPEAYDTLVGDGGTNVSGGQAQCIAVARALARRPKILLLDEPTSALDFESAAIIRTSIRAQRNRADGSSTTIIVVTHCEEMMKLADNVVVFEAGQVVEQGNYAGLMAEARVPGKLKRLLRSGQLS